MRYLRKSKYLCIAILIISSIGFWSFNRDEKNFEISKNLNIYFSIFRELNLFYVDEIDPGDLIKKSIDNMLNTLDPYTTYIPESKIEDFKLMTTGEYAGIGAIIGKKKNQVIISEPYKGFPAYKAGLKAGDILLEINDTKLKNKSVSDVSDLLKGQANVPLSIKIKRYNEKKPLVIKLIREHIQLKSVPYYAMMENDIAYIRLNQFTNKASKEISAALKALKKEGAKSLILDLRGNPGGLLNQSIRIVNMFVDKGEDIVSTKGKVSKWDKSYKALKSPIDSKIPIVVLVSRGSASASEIVSGALQDLDRAVIIGQKTFGKGLVQTTRNLSYNSKLKVTTAKYYIPSGRCIQALDYSHRNEDGSVGRVPDSLINEYKTKNGRKVFDGGGIKPDISIKQETYSTLAAHLIIDYMVFDYATEYFYKHETIAALENFSISDNDYSEFRKFLDKNEFSYKSESQKILEELKEIAKKEKYDNFAKDEFKSLSEKLSPNIARDLNNYKEEIMELINQEIIKRYYFQEGSIKYALRNDKVLKKAIETIKDNKKYTDILKGK